MRPTRWAAVPWVAYELAGLLALVLLLAAFRPWPPLTDRRVTLALLVAAAVAALFLLRRERPIPDAGGLRMGAGGLALLGLAFLAAWVLRLLPYRGTSIPLGYDYGFYKTAFDAYQAADLPLNAAPHWLQQQFTPGLPALHTILHAVTGMDATTHLTVLEPLLAAALALPAFVLVRARFGTPSGLVAAGLSAVAFPLFAAHEYLYEKNLAALLILCGGLFLLLRGAWLAAGFTLGALGVWHPPTFLFTALGLLVAFGIDVARKGPWRRWLQAAAASLPAFLPAWLLLPAMFLPAGLGVLAQTGYAISGEAAVGGGTFFGFPTYLEATAAYLPLALAFLLVAVRSRRAATLAALFATGILYAVLRLPFHDRFLIMVDLAALLVAAPAAWRLVPGKPIVRAAVALTVILLAAVPTTLEALKPDPTHRLMTEGQREAIAWVAENVPPDAVVVSDNLVSPYVAAEGGHRTFGPGLFDDPHNRTQWASFYTTRNATQALEFFRPYAADVYVFQPAGWAGQSFQPPLFKLVYDGRGARVWHLEAPA
ncbi:MAG: hypothetical protein QOG31_1679 [Thermoplasmata archaeon]|jgi:hypothetical protein|nr:hypothetical protein [Thermoplasmata archaeon]